MLPKPVAPEPAMEAPATESVTTDMEMTEPRRKKGKNSDESGQGNGEIGNDEPLFSTLRKLERSHAWAWGRFFD